MSNLGIGLPAQSGKSKRYGRRQPSSSLYEAFEPEQVKQFKEAFNMVDQDADGFISESDLTKLLQQLGQDSSPNTVASYFEGTAPGQISFTSFLTMYSDHLLSLDPEDEMLEAFACFDEQDTGYVSVAKMREFLSGLGDRMSTEEISRFLSPPFVDRHGNFAYRDFLKVLRITDADQQQKLHQQQQQQQQQHVIHA